MSKEIIKKFKNIVVISNNKDSLNLLPIFFLFLYVSGPTSIVLQNILILIVSIILKNVQN